LSKLEVLCTKRKLETKKQTKKNKQLELETKQKKQKKKTLNPKK
jgi:hypothetical protein